MCVTGVCVCVGGGGRGGHFRPESVCVCVCVCVCVWGCVCVKYLVSPFYERLWASLGLSGPFWGGHFRPEMSEGGGGFRTEGGIFEPKCV